MNRDTEVTLDQVHAGIVAAIQGEFPGLHVEVYRQERKGLPTPACLVELTELEPADEMDPGTEQLAVMAAFEAQLIIGFRQPQGVNPKLEIRRLAASVAAFARLNRWGCPIGPAQGVGAYPDDFDPELDQFEVWRVSWRQVLHLGKSVWNATGIIPSIVLVSDAPKIGIPHETDYRRVNEAPPTDTLNETTLVLG